MTSALPYDAILFDLDGTLVDTAPDIADALNAALAEHGGAAMAEPWVRDRIGNGTRALLEEAFAGAESPPMDALLESFRRHFVVHCGRRGRLFQDAAGTLALLRRAGIRLGLLTNKERSFAEFVLKVHGLDDDFDALVCGDTLGVKKPDARVVAHALEALDVPKARALLVGDSEIDVRTARNAGIPVWCVTYGYNRGRPIAEAKPDRLIRSLRLIADTALPIPETA